MAMTSMTLQAYDPFCPVKTEKKEQDLKCFNHTPRARLFKVFLTTAEAA